MDNNYINDVKTHFKNVSLNARGAERTLYEYIDKGEVWKVVNMMDNNDREVDNALSEYNPQNHPVMMRPNKKRKNDTDYITEKLPRTKERYINEIELFFLLGKPIEWELKNDEKEAFELFEGFMDKYRMNSLIRKAKRLAGSETESAIVFHLTKSKNGERMNVKPFVVARSLGYRMRTLFDQYGDLVSFAYGYRLRGKEGKTVRHWDILTKDFIFECQYGEKGWEVETFQNPTGKINAVYFHQLKAWDGAVPRLQRMEMLDSKRGDTNNYFSDPMAMATADVIDRLGATDRPGRLIQLTGANSRFDYINPPQNSASRVEEKQDLEKSTLFDTFTPDFSYDNLKGMGTLSGAAMRNALMLGYIKRDNLTEHYGEMIDRLRSVIVGILKVTESAKSERLERMKIAFKFGEPFEDSEDTKIDRIIKLRDAGLMSLETAVRKLGLVEDEEAEIDRLYAEEMEKAYEANLAQVESQEQKDRMAEMQKAEG